MNEGKNADTSGSAEKKFEIQEQDRSIDVEQFKEFQQQNDKCLHKKLLDLPLIPEVKISEAQYINQLNIDNQPNPNVNQAIETVLGSPLDAQGTISVEGNMISFVAHNLNELLKKDLDSSLSSWAPHDGYSRSPSTGSISSSNSGWSSTPVGNEYNKSTRFLMSPEEIPVINPNILNELEHHTKLVAGNLSDVMKNFQSQMHKISNSSLQCMSVYKDSVDITCDSVDSSIKSMYALIAKCEELGNTVQPIYKIQSQIKEIKRLLDVFEKQLSDDEC